MAADKPWQDRETLRELYVDKRMSTIEIAEHFDNDITDAGIGYWIDKHGIEKRSRSEAAQIRRQKELIKPYTDPTHGYEILRNEYDGVDVKMTVHRLLAVAEFGIEAVKDMDVHHNAPEADRSWGVPWDNRPDVIELVTEEEHARIHHTGHHDDEPWHDVDRLRELRIEKELPLDQVGEELGCSGQTIRRSLQKYDVEEAAE